MIIFFCYNMDNMKREQVVKILKVAIISTIIMLLAEAIFSIPAVNNWFGNIIKNTPGFWVWFVIWVIMFLQVTILNIPAYVILSASISIGIEALSVVYILVVLSAYMAGCLVAYWLGYRFGRKAVRWCAGSDEDYNKWSNFLNKKGKLWYFLTVLFPFFPDDLLCLVAGGVKFSIGWYILINFVGRGIGLVTMLYALQFITNFTNGFPIMLIVWAVALIAEIIIYYIVKSKLNAKENTLNKNQTEDKNQGTQTTLEKNEKVVEDKKETKVNAKTYKNKTTTSNNKEKNKNDKNIK